MSRPKLLLADDSVTIRKVVELTFADEGIDVTAVGDAESAMQKFVEDRPDIVLVDVGLDGTSGYHICEMIKADEATSDIPVLLLVGSFEPFDQDEAERVGADGFLTKPFHSIRDLVTRVKDLLSQRSGSPDIDEAVDSDSGIEQPIASAFDEKILDDSDDAPVLEDEDIENLYRRSFAETAEIDEYDTVDDLLGDKALDDEMIEATYPTEAYSPDLASMIPEPSPAVTGEVTKEFDWSTDSIVSESPAAEPEVKAFEPKFVLDDEPMGDAVEVSTAFQPFERVIDEAGESAPASEPEIETIAEQAADASANIDAVETGEHIDGAMSDISVNAESSESIAEVGEVADEAMLTITAEPPAIEQPGEDLKETTEPEVWPDVESEAPHAEPAVHDALQLSPEQIDIIVEKVVERLSDRVVREVALESVPRVAEKLIREALDNSGRKD